MEEPVHTRSNNSNVKRVARIRWLSHGQSHNHTKLDHLLLTIATTQLIRLLPFTPSPCPLPPVALARACSSTCPLRLPNQGPEQPGTLAATRTEACLHCLWPVSGDSALAMLSSLPTSAWAIDKRQPVRSIRWLFRRLRVSLAECCTTQSGAVFGICTHMVIIGNAQQQQPYLCAAASRLSSFCVARELLGDRVSILLLCCQARWVDFWYPRGQVIREIRCK